MTDTASIHADRLRELAALIERSTGGDGLHTTAIPALQFSRLSAPMPLPMRGVQEAALCLIVQGAKRAILADEVYEYDASRFVVASVDLPVTGQVTQASAEAPYLCLVLKLSPATIMNGSAACAKNARPNSSSSTSSDRSLTATTS